MDNDSAMMLHKQDFYENMIMKKNRDGEYTNKH